jgi:phage FluMu protein Com
MVGEGYKVCYFCGEKATSDEHVPPKAMFPKEKSITSERFLIKVPSCKKHNEGYSIDDEYFAYVHASKRGANDNYENPIQDKILRALGRNPHLINTLYKAKTNVFIKNNVNGLYQSTWAFNLDYIRINRILNKISKAIIKYEFGILVTSEPLIIDYDLILLFNLTGIKDVIKNAIFCSSYPNIYKYLITYEVNEIYLIISFYDSSYYVISYEYQHIIIPEKSDSKEVQCE